MQTFQEEVVSLAKEWAKAKVPYKHRGTTKSGCDCSGLLIGVVQTLGFLKDFVLPPYSPDWNLHSGSHNFITDELPKYAYKINRQVMQPGDILLFRFGKHPSHLGIFVGETLFVHSYAKKHTWYGSLRSRKWSKRLHSIWRLKLDSI